MTPSRMGDYYAGLGIETTWREMLFTAPTREIADIIQLASIVFLGEAGSYPRQGWCDTQRAVLIADAFAFGALKYGAVGEWRDVPLDHHLQAAGRHFHAWIQNPEAIDEESGLTHESHFLARAIMIQWLRRNP